MTTFEITIIVLLTAIVVLLAWHLLLTRNNYCLNQTKELKRQQDFERLFRKIGSMELLAVDSRMILKELTDIVDKMHRNLCVEIADKMVDRVYKQPTSVNGTPCYAPDGICTNPCRDCINCPKRCTGGTWSTNTPIKAKGEMFQERFNDNKEE